MAMKPAKKTVKKSAHAASQRPDVVRYFQTKLEAEWGPYDLKRALDSSAQEIIVLDTRAPDAFEEEHIVRAINIPTADLEKRLNELPKDKQIVPYCWTITCHLATRAALLLAQNGYRVHELTGGIDLWKKSEFPVTGKEVALTR